MLGGGNKKNHHKRKNRHRQSTGVRAVSDDFFAPTSLPSVPGGLSGSHTQIVETLDNGRKVVSYITWAER